MEITGIKETCLYVSDLEVTKHFYHDLLDLPVIGAVQDRHIFFRAGTSVLLCFRSEKTLHDNHLPPHGASGIIHLAFEVNKDDYESWKNKLTEKGIKVLHEQDWKAGLKSFYFHDPDGHLLEIVQPGIWEAKP